MIRITPTLTAEEIVKALQAQPRDDLINLSKELLINHRDSTLLEEVADIVLAELERRANST